MTPTDIPKIHKKITPSITGDPSTPTTTRPMPHANGPAHRHKQYITRRRDDYQHDKTRNNTPILYSTRPYRQEPKANDIMSSADDRNNNSNAAASRGTRGDSRAFRDRTSGRGFHFNLNAQEALTQHPMRRGRGLQPPATDVISLAIGNYHDAPLNARKIDKNVYPTAADRINILETDPIYLYPAKTYKVPSPSTLGPRRTA